MWWIETCCCTRVSTVVLMVNYILQLKQLYNVTKASVRESIHKRSYGDLKLFRYRYQYIDVRNVCVVLCADDVVLVAESPCDLQRLLDVLYHWYCK